MDATEITRLRELLAKADVTPWQAVASSDPYDCWNIVDHKGSWLLRLETGESTDEPNALLIAAAVNALAPLLDRIATLERQLAEMKQTNAELARAAWEAKEQVRVYAHPFDALRDQEPYGMIEDVLEYLDERDLWSDPFEDGAEPYALKVRMEECMRGHRDRMKAATDPAPSGK